MELSVATVHSRRSSSFSPAQISFSALISLAVLVRSVVSDLRCPAMREWELFTLAGLLLGLVVVLDLGFWSSCLLSWYLLGSCTGIV
jgi:hypothetical protein